MKFKEKSTYHIDRYEIPSYSKDLFGNTREHMWILHQI